MTRNYFGTDGIRGRVGEAPMTPDFILRLGQAAGRHLRQKSGRSKVVIGKDTRLSGYLFESALEAGFASAGVDVLLVGPMPTPAIAYLTTTFRAQAGVVVSASHNPHYDNGVKLFGADGRKLPDADEVAIETLLDANAFSCVLPQEVGRAHRIVDAAGRYVEFCKGTFRSPASLHGLRIGIDCANGATYHVAGDVLRELGANVTEICVRPDGFNINQGCGATDLVMLQKTVVDQGLDLGIAFDGDGDRCMMVNARGEVVDGDQLMYIIAASRHTRGKLHGPVVGTLMSNLGVAKALQALGIEFVRAKVGDRYVMEELRKHGGVIGGESSGHVLCLDRTSTGDGIVTALQVLAVMVNRDEPLHALLDDVTLCPQVLRNVRLGGGKAQDIVEHADVVAACDAITAELGERGRVLLRPSGTEPVIRVMVEGEDGGRVKRFAEQLADCVRAVSEQVGAAEAGTKPNPNRVNRSTA